MVHTEFTLEGFDARVVHEDAVRILCEIGLKVPDSGIKNRLGRSLSVKGEKVLFGEEVVEEFTEEIRSSRPPEPDDGKLTIFPSGWSSYFVDPETSEVKPYDTKTLSDFTKLVSSLADEGVVAGGVPGFPLDVPPQMQVITQYYINCLYNRRPSAPGIAHSSEIMKFLVEMANVMEHEVHVGVEPISPLTFAGSSVEVALEFSHMDPYIWLDPMPMMGISAPLDWHAAWAQAVAENLGSYVILRILGLKKIGLSFRLFPASMLSGMIFFGSPQYLTSLLTRKRIREFYNLPPGGAESMLTLAKLPDPQAAAEKCAQTTLAALAGFRTFDGAGTLAIDEVFSPQQLMIDIEIKNYVENILKELGGRAFPSDALELVKEGIDGSFLSAGTTLDRWRSFYWLPELFDQTSRAKWEEKGRKILDRAWELAKERIPKYDYELEGSRRRKLEEIVQKAKAEMGGET